jgi:glycosyltransferase involved in cell wall biosynthesis
MRNKVLLDLRKLSDPYSGLGQFSLALAKALMESSHSGHLLFLLPEGADSSWCSEKAVFERQLRSLAPTIRLVHRLHQESDLYVPGALHLLTVHDINFIYKYRYIKLWYKKKRFLRYLRKHDRLVCISRFTAQELSLHFQIPPDSMKVVYNGCNTLAEPGKPSLIPNHPFFFSIGAFLPKKNLHVLLPMMKYFPDTNWLLAGHDRVPYAQKLKRLLAEAGLQEQVIFTGTLSEAAKSWYYQNCRALLFPSVSEGFGLPVLEAYSAGKPLAYFPFTALPEIAGPWGLCWSPNESPEQWASQLKEFLSKDSSEWAMKRMDYAAGFSWNKAADDYLRTYDEMLGTLHRV